MSNYPDNFHPAGSDTVTVEIRSRWDNSVIYSAAVPADVPEWRRVRVAVEMAVRDRVRLDGASLDGARPDKATAAPLRRATRADGYEFLLWPTDAGWRVRAGCRFFTLPEARDHWTRTRAGTPIGDETADILDMFERAVARADAKEG